MRSMRESIRAYVAMKRCCGYKVAYYDRTLLRFYRYLKDLGEKRITSQLYMRFVASMSSWRPGQRSRTLSVVRGFAKYRKWEDPRTEVPPMYLFPSYRCEMRPHIYTDEEVRLIMRAMANRRPLNQMSYFSYWAIVGTLAATGMRLGEVLRLETGDVDLMRGILTIREGKNLKSRSVPVHASVRDTLRRFSKRRARYLRGRPSAAFFCNGRGGFMGGTNVANTFQSICIRVGIRKKGTPGPRMHDLRHTFAIKTILRWYRAGKDVNQLLPILSTYLGHVNISSTYWYLKFTPEVGAEAIRLLERKSAA